MAREIKRKSTNKTEVDTANEESIINEGSVNNLDTVANETVSKNNAKPASHNFEQTDLILCRSVTQGEMFYPSKTSGILYRWSNFGDVREVEYRDLYSLKSGRSGYLYDPKFVIEDQKLLSDPRWQDIKEIYDNMYDTEDLNNILTLPIKEFEKVLKQMPYALKQAIAIEVASRISDGTFDSIKKVQIINEVCDTELAVE